MKYAKRGSLKPGQVFVCDRITMWRDIRIELRAVLIVVDDKREQDIWTGATWALGDVMPAVEFEVLL